MLHRYKKRLPHIRMAAMAVFATAPFFVSAHTYPEEHDSLYHDLPEFVHQETAREVKSAATVYNIDIANSHETGIATIGDALRRLPGVTIKDYGGAGGMKSVSIRGLGAQHTGVTLDGVAVSNARSGQIDLNRYSLDNTSGMQLTIGDSDDIFVPARNASAPATIEISSRKLDGAVPVISHNDSTTMRPRLDDLGFQFGSFQLVGGRLQLSQTLSDNFAIGASGDFTHAKNNYPFRLRNGAATTTERRENSRMDRAQAELHTLWSPDGQGRLSTRLHYYDNDRQLPGQVRFYANDSKEALHDREFFAQVSWKSPLTTFLSRRKSHKDAPWRVPTSSTQHPVSNTQHPAPSTQLYLRIDGKFDWTSSKYRDPSYPQGMRDADYYEREAYAGFNLMYRPHRDWSVSYAADYTFRNLSSNQSGMNGQANRKDPKPLRHAVIQTLAGRYNNGRLSVTARLIGSLYYNKAQHGPSARDARKLSPSVSASFRVLSSEPLFVRAAYKNIFRMPTFSETYYFHFGTADLKPESTDQLNLGLTWQHTFGYEGTGSATSVTASLDGYLNHVRDMIVAVPYNMFIWTCINVGKVRSLGLDLNLNVRRELGRRHALTLMANGSWLQARNRSEKDTPSWNMQIPYTPEFSGGASLCWENPWVDVTFSGTATSSRWSTNDHLAGTDIPGYADFNLTLFRRLQFGKHQVELRGDLRNLFNRQYEVIRLYPMPGINYRISIAYKFN